MSETALWGLSFLIVFSLMLAALIVWNLRLYGRLEDLTLQIGAVRASSEEQHAFSDEQHDCVDAFLTHRFGVNWRKKSGQA